MMVSVMAVLAFSPALLLAEDQTAPAANFKFTKIDQNLLDDVNEYNRQLEKKGLVFHEPGVENYVEEIGKKLIANQPPLENVEFHFRVLRDPMVNAFAFPNGTVYVTTGLLGVLENEAQLASVLGHEATHVINRHTYLENRSMRKKVLAINILQGVAANVPGGNSGGSAFGLTVALIGLGSQVASIVLEASIYGYSQEKEREADRHGYELMNLASYDARAMARTFELLDEKLEFEPIEGFYRTHPKLEERRKTALARSEGESLKDARVGTESDYLTHAAPAICANIESDLISRRARTAAARASRLTKWKPDEPKYQVLQGDAYRSLGAKAAEPTEEEQGRHGQAEHRKLYFQMTEQEEQAKLLAKPDGSATRAANLDKAEKLYAGAIEHDPNYAAAHRELGLLYEQESKPADAAREYRKYLELTNGTSLDRLRIERRLAQVERAVLPPANSGQ
ncbi:MAG TPA: M48 family metalloprotease [Bryobacteraceae bacterium]|nr:M48 family metalloprotease [Bryobacteraceae bacterium]